MKSTKAHLKRLVGQQKLTYEELSTVLCRIESCLNSLPLLPLNAHSEDGVEFLTPAHFLVGRPLHALPQHTCAMEDISLLKRWSLCQALAQHWWSRWSQEYLQQLQRMTKWRNSSRNFQPDDVVLVKEDSPFNNRWPMARIVDVLPGKHGRVRFVTVKTKASIYKRPITKLVLIHSQADD